jgi:hypothetical protein
LLADAVVIQPLQAARFLANNNDTGIDVRRRAQNRRDRIATHDAALGLNARRRRQPFDSFGRGMPRNTNLLTVHDNCRRQHVQNRQLALMVPCQSTREFESCD